MGDDLNPFNVQAVATLPVQPTDEQIPEKHNEEVFQDLEDDKDLVIEIIQPPTEGISGVELTSMLLCTNVVLTIIVYIISEYRGTKLQRPDTSVMIRKYTQKAVTTNFVSGMLNFGVVVWIEVVEKAKPFEIFCYRATGQARIALTVVGFSIAIGLFRFLAYGYAQGQSTKTANKNKDTEKSFEPTQSPPFMKAISAFQKVTFVVFLVMLFVLFEFLPASLPALVKFNVCTVGMPNDVKTKVVFCFSIFFSMHVGILVTEILLKGNLKFNLHLIKQLVEGEYAATALGLNGFGWFSLLFIMWFVNTSAVQCLILAQFFTTIDSAWTAVICIATPNSKIVSLV